jgi:hypothetical protein
MWNPDQIYAAERTRWAELRAEGERRQAVQTVRPDGGIGSVLPALACWFTAQQRRADSIGTTLLHVLTKR